MQERFIRPIREQVIEFRLNWRQEFHYMWEYMLLNEPRSDCIFFSGAEIPLRRDVKWDCVDYPDFQHHKQNDFETK